ncbi:hypothetical protein LTR92_007807 [Exophiala xenobiotica]|nr:hypothetical protein LTR92_007807 [Exophiala xenobiotica]
MPLAICIQHQLESEEKAEKLRSLLDDVARVTLSEEPDNRAYCWFRKSPRSTLQGAWIAGFELYNNEYALTTAHRSSPEYKAMRQASAEEQLWGKVYPEIIFLEPLNGWGFLSKDSRSSVLFKKSQSTLVVLTRFEFDAEDKDVLYRTLSELSDHLRAESGIISYLPLVRQDRKDLSVTVFEQYTSEEAYASFRANSAPLSAALGSTKWQVTATYWADGIGHIRGLEAAAKPKILSSDAPAVSIVPKLQAFPFQATESKA